MRAASLGVSHLLNELQIVFIAAELILRNGFNAGNVAKAAHELHNNIFVGHVVQEVKRTVNIATPR